MLPHPQVKYGVFPEKLINLAEGEAITYTINNTG
jgi:hypothetical protein